MAQTLPTDGKADRILLAQAGLQHPRAETGGLPARIAAERRHLTDIQAVAAHRLVILHIFGFRAVAVVFIDILHHHRRRNRLKGRARISEQPVFDITVRILRHRVGIRIHHHRKTAAVPNRQTAEHTRQIGQQFRRLPFFRQIRIADKARLLAAEAVVHQLVAVFRDLVQRPLVDIGRLQTARQSRITRLRQHIVKHPSRIVRPRLFKRTVPHRTRVFARVRIVV